MPAQGRRAPRSSPSQARREDGHRDEATGVTNERLLEAVRAGRERLRALSLQLVEAREAESRHLARELHDEIGQLLTALKITLDSCQSLPPDLLDAKLGAARDLVGDLLSRVRHLSLDLRPPMLDDLGLVPALVWYFERYEARTGIGVAFEHDGLEARRFAPAIESAAYRTIQEALTNVARHAGVSEVEVRLWAEGRILGVQVEDRGAGFHADAMREGHLTRGLAGLRERVNLVAGRLAINSAPGEGTRVTAELPIEGYLDRRRRPRD